MTGGGVQGGGARPAVPGGGGVNPTSMAQNDTHVALIILTTQMWGGELLVEKTFSGQNFVFLRLRRQHPLLHKTKGPTRNPFSPTPPPLLRWASMSPHPAEQFSGRPGITEARCTRGSAWSLPGLCPGCAGSWPVLCCVSTWVSAQSLPVLYAVSPVFLPGLCAGSLPADLCWGSVRSLPAVHPFSASFLHESLAGLCRASALPKLCPGSAQSLPGHYHVAVQSLPGLPPVSAGPPLALCMISALPGPLHPSLPCPRSDGATAHSVLGLCIICTPTRLPVSTRSLRPSLPNLCRFPVLSLPGHCRLSAQALCRVSVAPLIRLCRGPTPA